MSTEYKKSEEVPLETICSRLNELSDAVTKGRESVSREFTMRIPAEVDRDADLVLCEAAKRLQSINSEAAQLRADAERYRYIRDIDRNDLTLLIALLPTIDGEVLDTVIDKYIAARVKTGESRG